MRAEDTAAFANAEHTPLIALCGNPNVGKSTLFNCLTGLRQHTGNWTGKTVETAYGGYKHNGRSYRAVDLPGCYSLEAASPEEKVAGDVIALGRADCTVIVCDAECLERSLFITLQVLKHTKAAVLCINFMAAAKMRGIHIDTAQLEKELGIEVTAISRMEKSELNGLKDAVERAVFCKSGLCAEQYGGCNECCRDTCSECRTECRNERCNECCNACSNESRREGREEACSLLLWKRAAGIAAAVTKRDSDTVSAARLKLDRLLTGRVTGRIALILLFGAVLYITMAGSNYPSQWLSSAFESLLKAVRSLMQRAAVPEALTGAVCDGMLYTLFTVVSVMLPPTAIFFCLFSLLEEAGILPRFAFDLDKSFEKCRSCGRQALTMCMGLGCNAVGITGCRIIGDGRRRLAAILTNSLMPCNGRFPALITLISAFAAMIGAGAKGALSAAMLGLIMLLALAATLLTTSLLTHTALKGGSSSFILELPPYRRPRFFKVIVRAPLFRTGKILARAAAVSAPAGIVIWLLSRLGAIEKCAAFLEPIGSIMGLNGGILLGFILGLPANELILPLTITILSGAGGTGGAAVGSFADTAAACGLSPVTLICMTVLMLFHSPCATALLTVKHETRSIKWMLVSIMIPSAIGVLLCIAINALSML